MNDFIKLHSRVNMTFYQFLCLMFAIVKRTFIDKSDKIDSYRVRTDFQCVAKDPRKQKRMPITLVSFKMNKFSTPCMLQSLQRIPCNIFSFYKDTTHKGGPHTTSNVMQTSREYSTVSEQRYIMEFIFSF